MNAIQIRTSPVPLGRFKSVFLCSHSPTLASEQQSRNKTLHCLKSVFLATFYASKQVLLQRIVPKTGQSDVGVTDAVELANVAFCEVTPKLEVEYIPVLPTVVGLDGWVDCAVDEAAEVHEDEEVQVARVEHDVTSEIENEYSGAAEDDVRKAGKDTEVPQEYVVREAAGDVEQVVWVVAKVEAADDDGRGFVTDVA